MPSIVAVPYPTRGHVLLEINAADVPGATHICVEAVTATGRRQLHPYVSYNDSGCMALSCGQAIMWDTEISCDTPTTYCATAVDAAGNVITQPAAPLLSDTFSRITANGWGVADTGQTWTVTGGAAADYSTTGIRGQQALTNTGIVRVSSIPITTPNLVAQGVAFPTVLSTGASAQQHLWVRGDAAGLNGYRATLGYATSGGVTFSIDRVVGGVATQLTSITVAALYNAASQFAVKIQAWGSQLAAKLWDNTTPEPAAFQLTATDSTYLAPGTVNASGVRLPGNTNGTINQQWDNVYVADVCADALPVEVCTEEVVIACDGCFRLGDPIRPCNDVRICLCEDGIECGGDGGIFFAGVNPDVYAANSGNMLPVNGVYPITITRNRRAPTGTITVVPMSFADRDALLRLLAPGSTLLWRGPGEYGTGDRYLSIADVPVAPPLADLTQQPRIVELPFAATKAPVGPALGVCGARVEDLCVTYSTWDEMTAAGVTYAALLRGDAGGVPSGLATWASINAQNASWNALQAAETDWADVLDGD